MPAYNTIGSASTVQVLSAQSIVDAVMLTIETLPHHVFAAITIPQDTFTAGGADNLLTPFRNVIEEIMAGGKVDYAAGVQTLDANGLLKDGIDWTVGYTPPGAVAGPLTVNITTDLPTPVNSTTLLVNYHDATEAAIDAAYARLQNLPVAE